MTTLADLDPLAVSCRGLVKVFGTRIARATALRGVDLDVFAGELTVLVGPSGCGKTTLISIIAGILRADAGQVAVFGTPLDKLTRPGLASYRAADIGFVLQQLNLLSSLTALENTAVPLLVHRIPPREANVRAAALLESLDLGPHLMKYPGELSMGQQQRVALARALIHEPKLVICDEPTAALDAASGRLAMQMLRRVALRPDRAVLVVTHDPRVLPFADRVAMMSDGRITGIELASGREAA